jgi:hypothetical protein
MGHMGRLGPEELHGLVELLTAARSHPASSVGRQSGRHGDAAVAILDLHDVGGSRHDDEQLADSAPPSSADGADSRSFVTPAIYS